MTTRTITGIKFRSDATNVNKLKLSDCLYIAYNTIYPDKDVPKTKYISDTLKSFGITEITIVYHPDYKFTFTAQFKQYPDINKLQLKFK